MIRLLLLDLDDTLYSESLAMGSDITERMVRYVAEYLGMGLEEARAYREQRARRYGTTLEWLTVEEGHTDNETFFAVAHPEGEEYCINPDPELGKVLDSIALRKAILTNSPSEHAERVLRKLGIADRFEAVYDIRFNGLQGKPHPEAYRRVCEALGVAVEETLFVDDMPKYVRGFMELGGYGALIDEKDNFPGENMIRIPSLHHLPEVLAKL